MKSLSFTKKTIKITLAAFLLLWMQNVIAAGDLSSMRIGQVKDKTRVVFDLKSPQTYLVTELANPARLVVDFFNTDNSLSFKNKIITDSRLFKIRVSDSKTRVRVVLDLHKTPEYKTFLLDGKSKSARLVVDLIDKTNKPVVTHVAKNTVVKSKQKTVALKPKEKAELSSKPTVKETAKLAKATQTPKKKAIVSKKEPKKELKKVAKLDNSVSSQTRQSELTAHSNQKSVKAIKVVNKPATPLVNMAKLDKSPKISKSGANKETQILLNKESPVLAQNHEFIIAIDPGHGGKDTGAIGQNHIYEKNVTLMIAKELKKLIDRKPGMHAVLTRNKDVFIPLSQRVRIAKEKNADLFVSIHADAFHDRSVKGGSVYILSERGASSTMAKLLAKSENASLQDVSLKGMDQDVAFALSDLSRDANIKSSRKLAATVMQEMKKKVRMHKHSVQSAGFAVLKSIDMPSLLIETAFISNPQEARNLMSSRFRFKMASAITDGLTKYVKQQSRKPHWGDSLFVHYVVQKGDTLSEIAANYEVSTHSLKKLNGIKNANSLYVGKKIKIPVSDKLVAGI